MISFMQPEANRWRMNYLLRVAGGLALCSDRNQLATEHK